MTSDTRPSQDGTTPSRAGVSVSLRALRQTFGAARVLDGIDIDVPAGTTTALLGPSGCGKSTLLKLLAGLLAPTGGEIHFDDTVVASASVCHAPELRSLGMVFQDYALWPHMSVAANVAFPLEMRGVKRAERAQRVEDALSLVGLAGLGNRRPQALSGGQQQRVALARAIVSAPRLLLFDEPLSNLDRDLRTRLCADIGALLSRLGTTAVYVTHDREEAEALADQIVILAHGRVDKRITR
ncbi:MULTISPECIES: ABC transporter ATP-binding protein [Pandoraea]|uniref:ABC transporter ATP-binding protein n=1 Tax=Pandoraea TaxID=93217 RepID=UPI001F5DA8B3|nr:MULTISPECIES: ABC transporter ATP-binding protein [Pandoraea]MCI3204481.1 ABC transporter substrate-binding protein [Pandoraea sp. LA3]MDN4582508.1 ABC transporter substrate-binding protein [Pandoraea capi]